MSELSHKSIVLLGCKFCGKSTHGRLLAQKLGMLFYDVDDVLKATTGHSYRELLTSKKLEEFLLLEEEACRRIIKDSAGRPFVVATGFNMCDNPPALNILREAGHFVCIQLEIGQSVKRVMAKISTDGYGTFEGAPAYVLEKKPETMSDVKQIITEKYEERYREYRVISDSVVTFVNAPVEENFNRLCAVL